MIRVVTSNQGKWFEISQILREEGIDCVWVQTSLPEIQAYDLREVVRFSADEAYRRIGGGLLLEDSGLFVEALGGFPGPYSSYVYRTIGIAGLLKLLEGRDDRDAFFLSVVCLVTEAGEKIVEEGRVDGYITYSPRGSGGFGFDPIFTPKEAHGITFAEMTLSEKNSLSHRGRAVRRLAVRIKEGC